MPRRSLSTRWRNSPGLKEGDSTVGASRRQSTGSLTRRLILYDYLFDTDPVLAAGRGQADPRFRTACEIYNAGVERLIRAAQTKGQIQPQNGEVIPFKVHGREQSLRIILHDSPWKPTDVHKILLASDFEVTGLSTLSYSQYGLGVPLIGVRETPAKKGRPQARGAILSGRDGLPADSIP